MAAIVMTTRKALPQLIAEPAIHAAVSTAAIEIKATKSTAGKTVPKLMEKALEIQRDERATWLAEQLS